MRTAELPRPQLTSGIAEITTSQSSSRSDETANDREMVGGGNSNAGGRQACSFPGVAMAAGSSEVPAEVGSTTIVL
jgi:hypothetical protein